MWDLFVDVYLVSGSLLAVGVWVLALPEIRRRRRQERLERATDALLVTVKAESGEEIVHEYRVSGAARDNLIELISA